MITAWELYLWTRLDMFEGFQIVAGIFIIGSLIASMCLWTEDLNEPALKILKFKWLKIAVIIFIITSFIPTKKDAAMIWVIPQLATVENVETLQGEAAEIYKLAKDALKESIGVEEKE